jgi:spore germination cell wall hydrolase CwlJ-like protein
MIFTIVVSAGGSGAAAQNRVSAPVIQEPMAPNNSPVIVSQLPADAQITVAQAVEASQAPTIADAPDSLAELVAVQNAPVELSSEMHCLAGAIYFEAKSETLAGQLAVGRVIVARSKSGRFPTSYCGVVYQPSQFSFVRGRSMPAIPKGSKAWKNAVAVAQIAHENSWSSPVEGALFFHAAYVSPEWRLRRLGRVDNHVFYR